MSKSSFLPSLHRVLQDNVLDAFVKPSAGNWAAQVIKHFWSLGLPAPSAPEASVSIKQNSFSIKLAGKKGRKEDSLIPGSQQG